MPLAPANDDALRNLLQRHIDDPIGSYGCQTTPERWVSLDTMGGTSAHWLEMLCRLVSVRPTADSVTASYGTGIELTLILPV